MTIVAAICVDKFGRKPLLLLSGLGTCLSLFALGVFFFLDENKKDITDADIPPPLIFNQGKILNKLREVHSFKSVKLHDLTLTFQLSMEPWWMKNMVQIQTLIHKSFRILVGYP